MRLIRRSNTRWSLSCRFENRTYDWISYSEILICEERRASPKMINSSMKPDIRSFDSLDRRSESSFHLLGLKIERPFGSKIEISRFHQATWTSPKSYKYITNTKTSWLYSLRFSAFFYCREYHPINRLAASISCANPSYRQMREPEAKQTSIKHVKSFYAQRMLSRRAIYPEGLRVERPLILVRSARR